MELKQLKNIIKNGGATLDKNLQNIDKKNGFMVSIYGCEKVYKLDELDKIMQDVKEYQETLKNNEYIGIWLDNGLLYLDKSKHYVKKDKAIKTGITNKQLAIYDIAKNKSIYLTKKAYIIYKYNKINNDIEYIKEYYNISDIIKDYKLENKKSIYNYIIEDIDDLKSYYNLLKNKYIIKIDNILINEI